MPHPTRGRPSPPSPPSPRSRRSAPCCVPRCPARSARGAPRPPSCGRSRGGRTRRRCRCGSLRGSRGGGGVEREEAVQGVRGPAGGADEGVPMRLQGCVSGRGEAAHAGACLPALPRLAHVECLHEHKPRSTPRFARTPWQCPPELRACRVCRSSSIWHCLSADMMSARHA